MTSRHAGVSKARGLACAETWLLDLLARGASAGYRYRGLEAGRPRVEVYIRRQLRVGGSAMRVLSECDGRIRRAVRREVDQRAAEEFITRCGTTRVRRPGVTSLTWDGSPSGARFGIRSPDLRGQQARALIRAHRGSR